MENIVVKFCVFLLFFIKDIHVVNCDANCPVNCQSGQVCPNSDCPYDKCTPGYWGRKCEHPLECLIPGDNGVHYRGTKNVRSDGKICVNWDGRRDFEKPQDDSHHNYCRHVVGDHQPNTWCYNMLVSAKVFDRWGVCDIPSCGIMCPAPNLQPNTRLKNVPSNGFIVNTTLTVECFSGYAVQDICERDGLLKTAKNCQNRSNSISRSKDVCCTERKIWSTDFPKCVATCNISSVKQHSFIVNGRSVYKYGDTIEVRCESRYVTKDNRYFICQNDMTWNDTMPYCSAICSKPILKPNSHIVNNHNLYTYNELLEISCNPGYQTDDKRRFICQDDTRWNGTMPYCYAICSKPVLRKHSKIFNEASLYKYQDNVTIVCDPGYETTDSTHLTCQDNRTWNRSPPVCTAITCVFPTLKNHSTALVKTPQIKYQDTITIVCDEGYAVEGTGELQCQANKLWDHDTPTCEEMSQSSPLNLKAIIGGIVSLLVVITLIATTIIVLKRRRRFQQRNDSSFATSRNSDIKHDRHIQTNDYKVFSQESSEEHTYVNKVEDNDGKYYYATQEQNITSTAVKVEHFDNYANRRLEDKESLVAEYKRLNFDIQKSMRDAQKAENKNKNSHTNIYPYDENRVKLRAIPNQPGSDYINASTITGYGCMKKYIAAQAPFEATLNDFWRMLWELNVKQIVMITSNEKESQLYLKYWIDNGSKRLRHYVISITKEDNFPDYTTRELSVKKNEESRTMLQYHFTSWPEKGVPKNTSTLINIRNLVCSDTESYEEPIVVHCSTGVGRTGTFIALDYLLDQAKTLHYVDVFECAEIICKQRINMIQSKEQYIYLHRLLRETLVSMPSTLVPGDDALRYQELLQRETSVPIYSTLKETPRTQIYDDLV